MIQHHQVALFLALIDDAQQRKTGFPFQFLAVFDFGVEVVAQHAEADGHRPSQNQGYQKGQGFFRTDGSGIDQGRFDDFIAGGIGGPGDGGLCPPLKQEGVQLLVQENSRCMRIRFCSVWGRLPKVPSIRSMRSCRSLTSSWAFWSTFSSSSRMERFMSSILRFTARTGGDISVSREVCMDFSA